MCVFHTVLAQWPMLYFCLPLVSFIFIHFWGANRIYTHTDMQICNRFFSLAHSLARTIGKANTPGQVGWEINRQSERETNKRLKRIIRAHYTIHNHDITKYIDGREPALTELCIVNANSSFREYVRVCVCLCACRANAECGMRLCLWLRQHWTWDFSVVAAAGAAACIQQYASKWKQQHTHRTTQMTYELIQIIKFCVFCFAFAQHYLIRIENDYADAVRT